MKFLISLIGFVAGIAAAIGFLLSNPLQTSLLPVAVTDNVYNWRALEFQGAAFGTTQLMNLPLGQQGEAFIAEGIATSNASLLILEDKNGQPAALATRIVVLNDKSDLLRSDVGVSTYTNIIWPNYGSLFLAGDENRWPIIRNDALQLLGESNYQPVDTFSVSALGHDRFVAGGSGGFAGVGGRYTEELYADSATYGRFAGRIALELETGSD
jgi:hypothetical protein